MMTPPIYNRKPMYYLDHQHWRQADANTSHACASPSSPGLYTWGTFTWYSMLEPWVASQNLFQTQDENQAKTKYKELSYSNPIVPSLISGIKEMSKRMTGSSLLGPLSSMWFAPRLCSDRPETLRPDILAKNCSDFSSVHQAWAVTFRTSNVWVKLESVSDKLPDEWERVNKVKSTWHTVCSVWCKHRWSLVQPPRWMHSKGLSVSCQRQIHRCWDIHCPGSMMVRFNSRPADEKIIPLDVHRFSSESRWQGAFSKAVSGPKAHIDERCQHFLVLQKAVRWAQLLYSTWQLSPHFFQMFRLAQS